MSYYIDLKEISIDKYKGILKSMDLLPSWSVLRENVEENLCVIEKFGVKNLYDLLEVLKTKNKLQEFGEQTGLEENYLAVLRRVVNGYRPKPNRLKDFPNIEENCVIALDKLGIKNTLQLYENILTVKKREELSVKTGIDKNTLLRLAMLTDLSRIKWVNHTFAYVLLEAGYCKAQDIAIADYQEIYERVKLLNKERKIYNAHIGNNDMKRCVEAAKGLDFEIELS